MAVEQPRKGRLVTVSRGHDQLIVRQFSGHFSGHFNGRVNWHFNSHLSVSLGGHFGLRHFRTQLSRKLAKIRLRSLSDSLFHPGSWHHACGRLDQIGATYKGAKKPQLVTEIFPRVSPASDADSNAAIAAGFMEWPTKRPGAGGPKAGAGDNNAIWGFGGNVRLKKWIGSAMSLSW